MEPTKTLPEIFYKGEDVYTIFVQSGKKCVYCERALTFFTTHNLEYTKYALDYRDMMELAAVLDHYTVPIIFKGKELVGGYDELVKKETK